MSVRYASVVQFAILGVFLVGPLAAEQSWPAGESGEDATYPNQGRRIIRDGNELHIVFSAYGASGAVPLFSSYYDHSDDLGENWDGAEAIDFGGTHNTHERDYKMAMDVDIESKPWFTGVVVAPMWD